MGVIVKTERALRDERFVFIWNAAACAKDAARLLGCSPEAARTRAFRLRTAGMSVKLFIRSGRKS